MNCGLIIPTLNAGAQFRTLLEQINAQKLPTRKLIVDSESTDDTAAAIRIGTTAEIEVS